MGIIQREKKQLNASSPVLFTAVLTAVVFAVLLLTAFKAGSVKVLRVTDQVSGREYYSARVKAMDVLTFSWIHSLENIPWTEEFIILDNNSLLLMKIAVPAFGAGIPHNKGKVTRIENGFIIMDEIHEKFERIDWIHSESAVDCIMLNGEKILRGEDLPHHAALSLEIEKGLMVWPK
jgi:hypothetical protein